MNFRLNARRGTLVLVATITILFYQNCNQGGFHSNSSVIDGRQGSSSSVPGDSETPPTTVPPIINPPTTTPPVVTPPTTPPTPPTTTPPTTTPPDPSKLAPVACATPTQESVNTSAWPEIFVGTAAQGCSDGSNAGTRQTPYCNPHLAMSRVTSSGRIVTFLSGEYRLTNFNNTSGAQGALGLPRVNSTANSFVIVRADAGATPVILGSQRLPKSWESYSASPRIFRINVASVPRDIKGLWQVVDGLDKAYTNAKRMRHIMVHGSSARVHAPVSGLSEGSAGTPETSNSEDTSTKNFTWTKANASGAACGDSNSGCYIYLRADSTTYNPNNYDFEIPQQAALVAGSSYMVLDGLHTRFSISDEVHFESISRVLIQNNSIGHLAAADGNSYALGLWFSNGSIVRKNKIFDSAYWGGTSNSKGLTFMVSGNTEPNWACSNEIYHIPGEAAIGSKGGVSNLRVIGNYIHDSATCVQTDHNRTQDGAAYPGGGWIVQQNIFERCDIGVQIGGDSNVATPELVINNVFVNNFHGVLMGGGSTRNSRIHNNIFIGGSFSNSCDSYGTCGAGIYFSNNSGEVRDFNHVLGVLNMKMSNNYFHTNLRYSHGVWRNWTPNFAVYSLAQFKSTYSGQNPEVGSSVGDPLLDASYKPLQGSPALNTGLGEFFNRSTVNMGIYP